MRMDEIELSVVATSRNDDHGGCLTYRMQRFVDGFVAQCKRHRLRAELILVEWNPPQDRLPLIQELTWPADRGPCDIRIITVPCEVHRTIQHADKIRLFQMIAKNVGIRRARGKFVLATNVDILFSDGAMRHLRDRLRPGCLYLADRVDVPNELPATEDFGKVLQFCDRRAFRINAGALTVTRINRRWRFNDVLKTSVDARLGYCIDLVEKLFALPAKTLANPRWALRRLIGHGQQALAARGKPVSGAAGGLAGLLAHGGLRIACLTLSGVCDTIRAPFTNACGDFTVMSREDWARVRGYAEWHMYSWHLDTLLVHQAIGSGIRAQRLRHGARVFHIDHDEGYTPERAGSLFSRLKSRGIPFLTDEELRRLYSDILAKRRSRQEVHFNPASWGLEGVVLPEASP